MRNISVLLIIAIILTISAPVYAAGNVLTAIPDDYYIHFFAGAALQGYFQKHEVAPMESYFITLGLALAKETIDSAVFGGQFDWAEVAVTVLGASFVYYF